MIDNTVFGQFSFFRMEQSFLYMKRPRKSTLKAARPKLNTAVMTWSSKRWQARVKDASTNFLDDIIFHSRAQPTGDAQNQHLGPSPGAESNLFTARGHPWHINAVLDKYKLIQSF